MRFRLTGSQSLCKGKALIKMAHLRKLMDPNVFLRALGEFPITSEDNSIEALLDLWNKEMARIIDTITPKCPLPWSRIRLAPWFTGELMVMK